MREKSCEAAWAAGLFEGEGCISFERKGEWVAPRLSLGMCDEDIVRRFHEIVGCGSVHRRKSREGWKPFWNWRTSVSSECADVLRLLNAYFGERRGARAKEALSICDVRAVEKNARSCVICGSSFLPIRGGKRLRKTCSDRCARARHYRTVEKPIRDALPRKARGGKPLSQEHRAKISAAQRRAWQMRKAT